jgi:phosphoribosylformylglycinamidine synthase
MACYRTLYRAIRQDLVASCHGIYRGGLAVHAALAAMAGEVGMTLDLAKVPQDKTAPAAGDVALLFAETPGRFIVTIDPKDRSAFEAIMKGVAFACVGAVTTQPFLVVANTRGHEIIRTPVSALKKAWKEPFKDLR